MEVKAQVKFIRMSPRKARLVADLIRGLDVEEALHQLQFISKAATKPIFKLLNSGIANAVNNFKLKKENLYIKMIKVDGGPTLKRWQPRAFGRATPIRKRSSHIYLVLAEKIESKKSAEKPKVVLEKPKVIETAKVLSKEAAKERKEEKPEEKKVEKVELLRKNVKKSKGFLKRIFTRKAGM